MTFDPKADRGADALSPEARVELCALLDLLLEEQLDDAGRERLARFISDSDEAQRLYISEMNRHAAMAWEWGMLAGQWEEAGLGVQGSGLGIRDSGFGVGDSGLGIRDFHVPNLQISKSTNQQIPSLSTTHYPLPTPFVGGPVFSYIAATLILGVMMLGAWAYTITHDYGPSLARNSRGSTTPGLSTPKPPDPIFVARVTGMKDCRWADPATETYAGAYIPLGRKYALSSGLMEITYQSGAKVILEGPCSYQVESSSGGFLALGKLTARVEKRSEAGGLAASAASAQQSPKTQALRPKTEISKTPNLQISKFAVRTPTAVVTDLGTEFGVSVAENGETMSHVFQGSVVMQGLAAASTRREPSPENIKSQIVLGAGQSARVAQDAETGGARITTDETVAAPKFVRRMPPPERLGLLDLLDIVCGGDGTGSARGAGIDPVSGAKVEELSRTSPLSGEGYRPVPWTRLIDGVFIPNGKTDAGHGVQLDSAGHAFAGFPATSALTYSPIWALAAAVEPEEQQRYKDFWMYTHYENWQFARERRGLLAMHANVGLTFDLASVRAAHPGVVRPLGFRASARLRHEKGQADIWVFVDGKLKYRHKGLRETDGPAPIDVPLEPEDRFLTLAVTDGDEPTRDQYDWVVIGDPVLRVAIQQTEQSNPTTKNEKEEKRH